MAWALGFGPVLAASLAGCADTVPGVGSRAADRDAGLRATAAADSVSLLARYDATAAAHPRLAARLDPLRSQVALHVQAFGPASTASPSASPSPSASASPSASPTPVPADQGAALKELADAESRTADARTTALRDASPELARLLASVAACGACHVLLLRGGA